MREPLAEVTFACQECGRSITFPGGRRGHVEACPECGNYVDVPHQTESSLPPEFAAAASRSDTNKQPTIAGAGSRTSAALDRGIGSPVSGIHSLSV